MRAASNFWELRCRAAQHLRHGQLRDPQSLAHGPRAEGAADFVALLIAVASEYPEGLVNLILDKCTTHDTKTVRTWHPGALRCRQRAISWLIEASNTRIAGHIAAVSGNGESRQFRFASSDTINAELLRVSKSLATRTQYARIMRSRVEGIPMRLDIPIASVLLRSSHENSSFQSRSCRAGATEQLRGHA